MLYGRADLYRAICNIIVLRNCVVPQQWFSEIRGNVRKSVLRCVYITKCRISSMIDKAKAKRFIITVKSSIDFSARKEVNRSKGP